MFQNFVYTCKYIQLTFCHVLKVQLLTRLMFSAPLGLLGSLSIGQ